jgi:hypothetical protein
VEATSCLLDEWQALLEQAIAPEALALALAKYRGQDAMGRQTCSQLAERLAQARQGGLQVLAAVLPSPQWPDPQPYWQCDWTRPTLLLLGNEGAGLDPALRSAGCGFFYGLLAFHLQRVDPDDSHLQAGLVGAVCGIRSLGSPLELTSGLPAVMMALIRGWLPLWLPLIGSALVLHSAQRLAPRLLPARRP